MYEHKKLPEPLLKGRESLSTIEYLFHKPDVAITSDRERQLLSFVLPPWQRPEVWDESRKRAFVEGIFLGMGTGFYVVHEADWDTQGKPLPMSRWLIDGQQRISAIRDFVNGDFAVFNDVRFEDMTLPEKRIRFMNRPFPGIILPSGQDEATLRQLYDRMNFSGRVEHSLEDRQRFDTAAPFVVPRDRG